jgi:hypothetical protein
MCQGIVYLTHCITLAYINVPTNYTCSPFIGSIGDYYNLSVLHRLPPVQLNLHNITVCHTNKNLFYTTFGLFRFQSGHVLCTNSSNICQTSNVTSKLYGKQRSISASFSNSNPISDFEASANFDYDLRRKRDAYTSTETFPNEQTRDASYEEEVAENSVKATHIHFTTNKPIIRTNLTYDEHFNKKKGKHNQRSLLSLKLPKSDPILSTNILDPTNVNINLLPPTTLVPVISNLSNTLLQPILNNTIVSNIINSTTLLPTINTTNLLPSIPVISTNTTLLNSTNLVGDIGVPSGVNLTVSNIPLIPTILPIIPTIVNNLTGTIINTTLLPIDITLPPIITPIIDINITLFPTQSTESSTINTTISTTVSTSTSTQTTSDITTTTFPLSTYNSTYTNFSTTDIFTEPSISTTFSSTIPEANTSTTFIPTTPIVDISTDITFNTTLVTITTTNVTIKPITTLNPNNTDTTTIGSTTTTLLSSTSVGEVNYTSTSGSTPINTTLYTSTIAISTTTDVSNPHNRKPLYAASVLRLTKLRRPPLGKSRFWRNKRQTTTTGCVLNGKPMANEEVKVIDCNGIYIDFVCKSDVLYLYANAPPQLIETEGKCPTCPGGIQLGEIFKQECNGVTNEIICTPENFMRNWTDCSGCVVGNTYLENNYTARVKCGPDFIVVQCVDSKANATCCHSVDIAGYRSSYDYFATNLTIQCSSYSYNISCLDNINTFQQSTTDDDPLLLPFNGVNYLANSVNGLQETTTQNGDRYYIPKLTIPCNMPHINDILTIASVCEDTFSTITCKPGHFLWNGDRFSIEERVYCDAPHFWVCQPFFTISYYRRNDTYVTREGNEFIIHTPDTNYTKNVVDVYNRYVALRSWDVALYENTGVCQMHDGIDEFHLFNDGESIYHTNMTSQGIAYNTTVQCVNGELQCVARNFLKLNETFTNDTLLLPQSCWVYHSAPGYRIFLHTKSGFYIEINPYLQPQYHLRIKYTCYRTMEDIFHYIIHNNITLCGLWEDAFDLVICANHTIQHNNGFGKYGLETPLCDFGRRVYTNWHGDLDNTKLTIRFFDRHYYHHYIRPNTNESDTLAYPALLDFEEIKDYEETHTDSRDCSTDNKLYNSTQFQDSTLLTPSAINLPQSFDDQSGEAGEYKCGAINTCEIYENVPEHFYCTNIMDYKYDRNETNPKRWSNMYHSHNSDCTDRDTILAALPTRSVWIILPKPRNIKYLTIWNRLDCCQSRLKDFIILVDGIQVYFNDFSNSKSAVNTTSLEAICKINLQLYPIPSGYAGQNVTLNAPDNSIINIAEMQIFGD